MAVVRIHTFGRVTIVAGAQQVAVSGRIADLLLLLLESSGGWVSRDALIDRLWADGEPPPSARSALRTYIATLRGYLGADVVMTRPTPCAYRLDRAALESDLEDVREALRVARLRMPTDPYGALTALTAARALVVGEPLGGIDNPWLIATRIATEELIDDLNDEFCAALVRAGVAVEQIEEIARLAEQRPLRERRTEMLMRALRQGGRRREALTVAAAHHTRMVDLTGLSASAEIRLLEQQLLIEDDREPSEAYRPTLDDLVGAVFVEPFCSTIGSVGTLLGLGEAEMAELVSSAVTEGLLRVEGDGVLQCVVDPVVNDSHLRWRERWTLASGLPAWRVLHHRLELGQLASADTALVIAAAGLAAEEGHLGAASLLLDRYLDSNRLADRFGRGADRRATIDLLDAHAGILEQMGHVEAAVDRRAQAVDLALAEDWVDRAAIVAAGEAAVGRSYVEEEGVTQLIRRTMSRLGHDQRSAHTVRLLSELLCRSVLDAGLTPELEHVYDRLVALRPSLESQQDQVHAYRARVYVAVSRGEVIESAALNEMIAICRSLGMFDHLGDFLSVSARNALESGDWTGWRAAVDALSDLASTTRRPIDLWTRVALRATDLQLRGQHQAAASQADDAFMLGKKWSIADAVITHEGFSLAAAWQKSKFADESIDERGQEVSLVGFARQILSRSYHGLVAPDDPLLDVMIRASVRVAVPVERSLESLPALLVVTQAAWNAGTDRGWQELLEALESWPVSGTAIGMIPIATFGPLGRFRALAAMRLGDLASARAYLEDALGWCDRMRASGWAAATLEDLALLEDREGNGRAAALRAEASYLRRSRRLRIPRDTTTWIDQRK